MCDPISASLIGGPVLGFGMYQQQRQMKKQEERMEKAMQRNQPPPPERPQKQAKYSAVRSSTTNQHRNVFTSGPFIPPSFGVSLGQGSNEKKRLGS